ncbi:alanine--tRNA ligase [Paratractidigestivibacter faecalis]|uniref:alanine--tRNA ligase n=1 Tax=Paratractidigestivibacter faecalis TaxID=2292441 RepID=UPI003AB26148
MSTADFPTMTTAEIRSTFLNFFEERGLKLYPSSSLVPDDPSLLLANAGMNQFKEFYQGKKTMKEIGACSCQKCVRTNDIDCIGEDGRHLSFFEMLGDFSFGGVSKQQACAWAFELITEKFKLPVDRLYFTVFTDDDETHDVWRSLGVAEDHISRLGEDDNFWAAGPTGPCGPCSEIYFDQGPEVGCGKPDCKPGCDCDRFLEFWNLVFTQYDRQEDGSMPELPHRNLDTGMGLERMAAILQHKSANYDGDLMQSLIALGEKISGKKYVADDYTGASRSLRIIADHARAVDFMISDGILPGNEGREYVLRRLLRRAVFHGRLLGIEDAFLTTFIDEVNRLMGEAYPELLKNVALVKGIVSAEEERFSQTLDNGRSYLDAAIAGLAEGAELPGEVAFKLHDTYGFPIDLTVEIAEACGHEVDMAAFDACMTEQKERARAAANRDAWGDFNNVWTALSDKLAATDFCGYDEESCEAKVLAIVSEGSEVASAAEGSEVEVVLDATPFYAEMGGQCGDTGAIRCDGATLRVTDTKGKGSLYAHACVVEQGTLEVGATVTATIDHGRRELIRRNHTATHLLDAALKQVLGEHVSQAGSLVEPGRLRFDFTHFEAMTADELDRVEGLVNAEIFAAEPIVTRVMSLEDARATGAVALFGEKYGDVVRVVSTGESDAPFSRELCGGTHARNTADLGFFKIVSESSVGSNARRIEAVTSAGAIEYVDERLAQMSEVAAQLKCRPADVTERVASLMRELRDTQKKLEAATTGAGSDKVAAAFKSAVDHDGYKLVIARLDGLAGKDMRSAWDGIRDAANGEPVACVIASATPDGKVALLAGATDAAVASGFAAGNVVKAIAGLVGGRGGGRPNMAQAGGSDISGIDAALEAAKKELGL